MHLESSYVNTDGITSFETILAQLKELEKKLSENKLYQFIVFNKAYYVVTSSIMGATDNDYFENPDFIEKFTVCFAKYYFQAVNDTLGNNTDLPIAWTMLNKAAKYKSTPNFIFLLMGANAHINHDLPLALLKLAGKVETDDLFNDVLKIDKILMKSGREIIRTFDESNKLLDFLKRNFTFLYYRPAMYVVLYWRIKAWRNYKDVKKRGIEGSHYQKSSIKIAKRFLKLARWLSGNEKNVGA